MNFREVVDALPDLVAVFDSEGACAFANRAFESAIGQASFRAADDSLWRSVIASTLATGTTTQHLVACVTRSGPRRFVASLSRVDDQVCARFVDAELAESEERRRVYLEATGTLLEHFDVATSLQAIVDLAVPVLADWCYIHLRAEPYPRLVAVANADPAATAAVRARTANPRPRSSETAVSRVLAGGPSELVTVSDETLRDAATDPDQLAELRKLGFRSAVVAPLVGRDGVLGAVTFALASSGRDYRTADLDMLAELARRTGIALDNARLFEAEKTAREAAEQAQHRMVRVQQLTEKLSGTLEQAEVVRVMVDSGRTALGAAAGFAWLLVGTDELQLVASEDPDPSDLARYERFSLSVRLPICDVVRTQQPMMFENLDAMLSRYPEAFPRNASLYRAWAVVPFVASGRALGGISFSFESERAFSEDDRALLLTMTSQAAIALERAQLIAAERAAKQAAEAAIRKFATSEENLRAALVAGRAATWRVDLRTMRSTRDQTYLQLTGYEDEQSAADFEAIHPEDRAQARAMFERTLREHVPYAPEVRILRGDNRYMWVRSHGRLNYDEAGNPTTLSGVMADIDDAKQASLRAEHERHVSETLLRLAAEFARVLDHDHLVELIVDEVSELIGAEIAAFVEGDADPEPSTEGFHWLVVPVVGSGGMRYGTLRFAHRNRDLFTTEHERLVASISKHASMALENARLYREMRTREAELEHAVEAARVANHRKDQFLAMLGHELRNPVAPIVTGLELIELKTGPLDREHRAIRRHVDHLRRLIDDLLDVSRIARGKLHLDMKHVELSESISHAVEMVGSLVGTRSQKLVVDVPAHGLVVHGDGVRLTQVLVNVLTNAAKYSDPGTAIEVRAKTTTEHVIVEVRDHGIGLSPELSASIFDLFVQGERALARSEGGLGIGLSVARAICEAHGGSISVTSQGVGHGSTFTIVLPRAEPAVRTSAARLRAGEDARILVVDDNVDAAVMLHDLLAAHGFQVAVAHDGPSALDLALELEPTIAVLDIGLPGMDGYELARRLRARGKLLLIAVTGYNTDEDRSKSREAGFEHHLAKPLKFEQLLRVVRPTASAI